MLRKNFFIQLFLALTVSFCGAMGWASDSIWDDPRLEELLSGDMPSEIEMWKFLKEGASEGSERDYEDDYDDNGNPIPWEPTKHHISFTHFTHEISTSTRSDTIELSEETRKFLRQLITGEDSRLSMGIFSEGDSTITFGWSADAGPTQMLYEMYLLKKVLEIKAPDLVIIAPIVVEPLGDGGEPGTVTIDD